MASVDVREAIQDMFVSFLEKSLERYDDQEKDDEKAKQKEKFKDFLKALLSGFGKEDEDDKKGSSMPRSAMEYVKMCEPELGVPPKINLDECIEIPLYVNGVQKHGALRSKELDNPNLQGKGFTSSGSVLQRYEGRTAEGKPLPDLDQEFISGGNRIDS